MAASRAADRIGEGFAVSRADFLRDITAALAIGAALWGVGLWLDILAAAAS